MMPMLDARHRVRVPGRWLVLLWLVCAAWPAGAGPAAQLLEQLGLSELPGQAPRVLALARRAHFSPLAEGGDEQLWQEVEAAVLAAFRERELSRRWRQALEALPPPVLEEALVRVQQPPVRRLAEAAEAPTDREQWRELERYQAGLRARPPRSDRAGLMERVVAAEGKAELAALLQSCIEELLMSELAHRGLKPVRPAASEWPSLLARRIAYQQQQQQLYSFYAYRFIDNATLEGWLAAMAEGPVAEALATVLEVSRQTLAPPLP